MPPQTPRPGAKPGAVHEHPGCHPLGGVDAAWSGLRGGASIIQLGGTPSAPPRPPGPPLGGTMLERTKR